MNPILSFFMLQQATKTYDVSLKPHKHEEDHDTGSTMPYYCGKTVCHRRSATPIFLASDLMFQSSQAKMAQEIINQLCPCPIPAFTVEKEVKHNEIKEEKE